MTTTKLIIWHPLQKLAFQCSYTMYSVRFLRDKISYLALASTKFVEIDLWIKGSANHIHSLEYIVTTTLLIYLGFLLSSEVN